MWTYWYTREILKNYSRPGRDESWYSISGKLILYISKIALVIIKNGARWLVSVFKMAARFVDVPESQI